ncbi:retrotransposon ORF1 [Tanacetum coccineum]|uniref:Retrotransposon ORF1 n=1 Tax=Tanacetum coccineum TaxID=301880 RepID=A0ABQ4XPR0_9ASTR
MAFRGNTRDLGSFGEETDEITDLHQILEEVLLPEHGDGVASIKRRHHDLFSDGVWNLETASGRGRLKEDLESSTEMNPSPCSSFIGLRKPGDCSRPSHEGYRNTIELPDGNNVVHLRSDTIRLVQNGCSFHGLRSEDPNQHLKDFLKLLDSLDLDVTNRERMRLRSITTWEDLTTHFRAQFFLSGRTAKLRNDILMFQQHHGESLSEAWTLVPTTLSIAWKIPSKPLLNTHPSVPMKQEGVDGEVMFIEIIRKNDDSREEGPKEEGSTTTEGVGVEYFDIFLTRSELAYHKYLMCSPIPSIFLRNPIITEGCLSNLKIPCNIRHLHVEKAYIDPNSSLNIMTRMMYNWIMRRKLNPRENSNRGVSIFIGRIKGMHVFVRNFTYVIDFMIVEDISSIIDPMLSQVLLRRPFIEISNMTIKPPEGVVRFTNRTNEVAYKMPHKIEQYNSLLDLEKEHTKSVYLRNEEDKRRGVELYLMRRSLEVLRKFYWIILEGRFNQLSHVSSPLLSKPEEY